MYCALYVYTGAVLGVSTFRGEDLQAGAALKPLNLYVKSVIQILRPKIQNQDDVGTAHFDVRALKVQ